MMLRSTRARALLGALVVIGSLLAAGTAEAWRPASAYEAKQIKKAHLDSYHDDRPIYATYVQGHKGVRWGTICVDRPGYSNRVFGRVMVRRSQGWLQISDFSLNNVGANKQDYANDDIPGRVYTQFQSALRSCASEIGAKLGPS